VSIVTSRYVWPFDEAAFRQVGPGMRRRVFTGDGLSLCFWRISETAGPTPYDGHPDNEQFGLVIAGGLDFRIGGTDRCLLGPGDVYHAPTNLPHGDSRFIPDGQRGETWILDVFSPVREEYRDG
jgi:hypothetical protein